MRFLCLHGLGTNADVLETQTGPLREALGGDHEFDFFDGDYETGSAEGIAEIFPGPYYSWLRTAEGPATDEGLRDALSNLRAYVAENGPYDGALGFSQGAAVIMALLFDHQRALPFEPAPFRVAVIMNSGFPPALRALVPPAAAIGGAVTTAHVLGSADYLYRESAALAAACGGGGGGQSSSTAAFVYEHPEAHAIPRRPDLTAGIAATVRRAIETAQLKQ